MKERENAADNIAELDAGARYIERLADFSDFYLKLVAFSGAAIAGAIAVAVLESVILGAALAFFVSSVYTYFTASELKKKLGLSADSLRGGIRVKKAVCVYGDTVYIPSRIMWSCVEELADGAFSKCESLPTEIYLPKSIKRIGKDIFGDNENFPVIYYEGTIDEWKRIETATPFEAFEVSFDAEMPSLPPRQKRGRRKKGGDTEENV